MNKMFDIEKILENDAILVNKGVCLDEILGKHLIITGASGLVGINMLTAIKQFCRDKQESEQPRITAIFQNKVPDQFKSILESKIITIKLGDVTDSVFMESLNDADLIVHAAGYGQPGKFMEDKIKTIEINTLGTRLLLNKLRRTGKFIFLSTSEIYSGAQPPHTEDMIGTTNPQHPRACYIEGKRCGEAICMIYKERGYGVKIARLALAYGPGTKKNDARVLNQLIEKGLKGPIRLMDKGEAVRTYCYIEDAVEILFNILLKGSQSVYNVGGDSTITIAKLAETIADITGSSVILGESSIRGSPDNVCLDMSRTLKEFPRKFVSLREGLIRTVEYQKKIYE